MKYQDLAALYDQLGATSKRLEKTNLLAAFLKKCPVDDLPELSLLLQGRLFPAWDDRQIGVASRIVLKAISLATGYPVSKIEEEWKKVGDLGDTAAKLVSKRKQATLTPQRLTIKKVFQNLRKLAEMEGTGAVDAKVKLISELLTSATPQETRYVIRSALEDLRVGVGDGTMRDAIVWAFFGDDAKIRYDDKKESFEPENREEYAKVVGAVQHAYDVTNDFGEVAILSKTGGLKKISAVSLSEDKPIKVMLYQKAASLADAFERVGRPCAFEFKYDGFRLGFHKADGKIKLYTRRLEEVTKQFPDVVEAVKKHINGSSFILEGEAVGFDPATKRYLPFQMVSQRIRRKYDIEEVAKKFPVEVNVFDIISHNGKSMLDVPFQERRKKIESLVDPVLFKIRCSEMIITESDREAQAFYEKALRAGEEGVMAKNLGGVYKPGSRVGFGVKVKPVMETLDLVITGAEWGTGKRSGWLSSYVVACMDKETGEFVEIGKVGTGIKELEESEGATFEELTGLLKPLLGRETGREVAVKPKIVIEVTFEEIQKSPTYSSGYALRFPRLKTIRIDKPAQEASTLRQVEEMFREQRGRTA
ncbi:ATP-dependent DNA ligase [Candidatus Woesearchaeota archaeon]|nr:ATP-dependent DNA ligase [Candidatus Woesearchaeota archaeon]